MCSIVIGEWWAHLAAIRMWRIVISRKGSLSARISMRHIAISSKKGCVGLQQKQDRQDMPLTVLCLLGEDAQGLRPYPSSSFRSFSSVRESAAGV